MRGQLCFSYVESRDLKRLVWDFLGGPVVLRLPAPSAGGLGLIPGQGTRSHMLQLKILLAATKVQCSQCKTRKFGLLHLLPAKSWIPISAPTFLGWGPISSKLQCQWVEPEEGLRKDLHWCLERIIHQGFFPGHVSSVTLLPTLAGGETIHKMVTPMFAWLLWSPIHWYCGPICQPWIWALKRSTSPPRGGGPAGWEGTSSLISP